MLAGEVDAYLLHRLEDELARLRESSAPLIVSFEDASFVDSTIVGALIGAARDADRNGKLFLCYLPDDAAYEVNRVFATTRLDSILRVCRSWDDVGAALEGRRARGGVMAASRSAR